MKKIWITRNNAAWNGICTKKPDESEHDAVVEVVIEDPDQEGLFAQMQSVEDFCPDIDESEEGMGEDGYFSCLLAAGDTVSDEYEFEATDQFVFCVHGPEKSRSIRVFLLHDGKPPPDVCGEPIQELYGLNMVDCTLVLPLIEWKPTCQAFLGLMSAIATAVLRFHDAEFNE